MERVIEIFAFTIKKKTGENTDAVRCSGAILTPRCAIYFFSIIFKFRNLLFPERPLAYPKTVKNF